MDSCSQTTSGDEGEYIMRSIVEIQEDIESLVIERMAFKEGSVEYASYDSDIARLENELDEAWEYGKRTYRDRLKELGVSTK